MLFIYLLMPHWCQAQLPYEMSIVPFSNNTTGAVTSRNRVEQYVVVCSVWYIFVSFLSFYLDHCSVCPSRCGF